MTADVYFRDYALWKVKLTDLEYETTMWEMASIVTQHPNLMAYYVLNQAGVSELKLMDSSPLQLYGSRNSQAWVTDTDFTFVVTEHTTSFDAGSYGRSLLKINAVMTMPFRQSGWRTVTSFTIEYWQRWDSAPTGGSGHVMTVGECDANTGGTSCAGY